MTWSGDNTGYGGQERVVVNVGQALADGAWSGSTTVTARAGWFNSYGSGPASLSYVIQDGSGTVSSSGAISYMPGAQSGCASTVVYTWTFTQTPTGRRLLFDVESQPTNRALTNKEVIAIEEGGENVLTEICMRKLGEKEYCPTKKNHEKTFSRKI